MRIKYLIPDSMRSLLFLLLAILFTFQTSAQNPEDYYYELKDTPADYTAGTIASRVVDGLGFRFYWATADLRDEDLSFKPTDESRTVDETINHIYGLTLIVKNATAKSPTVFPVDIPEVSFEEKRAIILDFIKTASGNLKAAQDEDFDEFNMTFQYADGNSRSYPFWNELNGPMADAIWHVGQVVMLRRMSGNPFNSNVSLLQGKLRN